MSHSDKIGSDSTGPSQQDQRLVHGRFQLDADLVRDLVLHEQPGGDQLSDL